MPPAQREHDAALRDLRDMRKREAAIVSAAKRELGIFSTDGVTESRNAFWVRRSAQPTPLRRPCRG